MLISFWFLHILVIFDVIFYNDLIVSQALLRLGSGSERCDGVTFLEGHVTHARHVEANHGFRYDVRGAAKRFTQSQKKWKVWSALKAENNNLT